MSRRRTSDHAVALLYAGANITTDEIGATLGVSGQRVRQRLARAREEGLITIPEYDRVVDPLRVMRALRSRATSYAHLSELSGVPIEPLMRFIAQAGLRPSADRLFRARASVGRRAYAETRRAWVVEQLREIAARLGRTPSTRHLMDHHTPVWSAIYHYFDSAHDAMERAGLTPLRNRNARRRQEQAA